MLNDGVSEIIMVNTNDLVRLWQHYDDQSKTPFTGHAHAKFIADRIDAILSSPNKTKLLRQLPKSASDAVSVIKGMNDVEFDAFLKGVITSSDIPACEPETEPPYEEPRYIVSIDYDRYNDFLSERWNVHLTRKDDNSENMKTVAAYAYRNAAEALAHILPTDQDILKELWTNL